MLPRRVIMATAPAGGPLSSRQVIETHPAPDVPGGEPIPPLSLDPGLTIEAFELACVESGIPLQRVDDVESPEFAESLGAPASLFLVADFPLELPGRLLEMPSIGAIKFHPSLLPRCRGANPVFWTLASGETQGGVTAHYMTALQDAGNIVAQLALPLTEEDDYQLLYRRAMGASDHLVAMVSAFLLDGGGPGIAQDPDRATSFPQDTEEDHRVHWAGRSPREVVALARTGVAFTLARGERLGILKAAEVHTVARERRHAAPGRLLAVNDDALVVEASGGAVALRSLAWRGRRHGGGELARALGLRRDEVLG
jgi:methionyl-tRNA formyltransferase